MLYELTRSKIFANKVLTVSVEHKAYATGVPSWVNTSDPFTWADHHHEMLLAMYFLVLELL